MRYKKNLPMTLAAGPPFFDHFHREFLFGPVFVQANRDVTRMEIFLSLVRLLEPSCDGGGSGENSDNVKKPLGIAQHQIIPATGHLR